MDGRRRYRGNNYNQEVSRTSSFNRKTSAGGWQQTVPLWEKRFCSSCKVPWNKIVDAKKYMHCHDNIVHWDDSAAEAAFHNAKRRYYAKTHGLPCDIEMPDPNLYIDEIDWDCKIDPELILDLERKQGDLDKLDKSENVVIFGDTFLQDQGFSSTGWGDCADQVNEYPSSSNVKGDISWDHKVGQNDGPVEGNAWTNLGENSWGLYDNNRKSMGGYGWGVPSGYSGWEADGYDSSGWYQYGNNYAPEYTQDRNGIYNTWYIEDGNKERNATYMPSYNTCAPGPKDYMPGNYSYRKTYDSFVPGHESSKIHGNDYYMNQCRRNPITSRNKVNFEPEQPPAGAWNPSRGKMTNSCAPVNNQASRRGRNRWSMDKPVS